MNTAVNGKSAVEACSMRLSGAYVLLLDDDNNDAGRCNGIWARGQKRISSSV